MRGKSLGGGVTFAALLCHIHTSVTRLKHIGEIATLALNVTKRYNHI